MLVGLGEYNPATIINWPFRVGLSVAITIFGAFNWAASAKTALHLLKLCQLGLCRVGRPARKRAQKTMPTCAAATRPATECPLPESRMPLRNGSATMSGNENRISRLGDTSTIVP